MRKSPVLNITVPNKHRTSIREAGEYLLEIPDGFKIACFGHFYFPDHDRKLFSDIIFPFLEWYRPQLIVILGGAIHDEAYQLLAPKDLRHMVIKEHTLAPEVAAARLSAEVYEERVRLFSQSARQFIQSFSQYAGDAQVVYVPSSSPTLPNESEIMTLLYYTQERLAKWRQTNPDRAPREEDIPDLQLPGSNGVSSDMHAGFVRLLGLTESENITVLPFGSAVILRSQATEMRFEVGNTRLQNPLSAAYKAMYKNDSSTVRSFDGKQSNGWMTQQSGKIVGARRHLSFCEVPNLMDSERMGYLGDKERWSKGFYAAHVEQGMFHGASFPIIRGSDGRRAVVTFGHGFSEIDAAAVNRHKLLTIDRSK